MVETKIVMIRKFFTALFFALLCLSSGAQDFSWSKIIIDGSRTGVKPANADNVNEALGSVEGKTYYAPNGRTFRKGTAPRVAGLLLGVQDEMSELKKVIAYAPEDMINDYPESTLSNWCVDVVRDAVSKKSGMPVHFAIINFGGIRVDIPAGDVLKDDIVSMFPFKNNLCYLELQGRDIRAILEQLAASSWQAISGARCVVKDGKLVSAEIDGTPLDDERIYGVATISFLLNGGDGISVAKNAKKLDMYDGYLIDVMLPEVMELTAQGKNLEYKTDGRIVYLD